MIYTYRDDDEVYFLIDKEWLHESMMDFIYSFKEEIKTLHIEY